MLLSPHLQTCPCLRTSPKHSRQIISCWEAQEEYRHRAYSRRVTKGHKQWRRSQCLANTIWSRWMREYMSTLLHRREPTGHGRLPEVDDIVLRMDETLPRNSCLRGRMRTVYPGADGTVRVVQVKTPTGVLRRATKKLVVLPK
ncbi:hypothetical protein EVAR_14187_1 [Eumeta japonica]|uniref:DUF5641 domain-containing protein n=1 Tax=Eumeta variegata TaxID=151549 RepID=A0A4C1UG09_EUMVA|nr:hypothetical protein EVAR_14187_1 [Eumeta japonica]